jgi:hypothetical protein
MNIKGPTKEPWRANTKAREVTFNTFSTFDAASGGIIAFQAILSDGRMAEISMGPIEAELLGAQLLEHAAYVRERRASNDHWRNRCQ